MPPKKTNKELLVLKLKRQSSTYVVECDGNDTLGVLKQKLTTMINSTNGLNKNDKPVSLEAQESLDFSSGLGNIPVPKIGLNDSSDSEIEEPARANDEGGDVSIEDKSVGTEPNNTNHVQVSNDEIVFGTFENVVDIYGSRIVELDESDETELLNLGLDDFAPIAFKLKEEEFKLYKPQYD